MTTEEAVQAVLIAAAGVTALVPASRIRVPGNWQNMDAPYIVHFPVSEITERTFEGLTTWRNCPFYQISIFAASYSSARAISKAVTAAMDGKHGAFQFRRSASSIYVGRDDVTNLEHMVLNFETFGHES